MNTNDDIQAIAKTITSYFTATYHGNASELKQILHPEAQINGFIENKIQQWNLNDFITRVTGLPTAATKKEKYDKKIISIDITNNIAAVKTKVNVGNYCFTDYILLLKIKDCWLIRNKIFTSFSNEIN